jgi:magnesium chelatase family protein
VLAVARTFTLLGIEAEPVHVELDVAQGLPAFGIVGLPDAAVRESRERVRSALKNSGFDFPLQRITASLAPADVRKAGPGFDLAIGAALLAASGQLRGRPLDRYALAGELALDGSIRPVPGTLAMAEGARRWGMQGIAVAPEDAEEAALVEGIEVVALEHLSRLGALADGELEPVRARDPAPPANGSDPEVADLAELRGQPVLRRSLEIAAAGGHSVLLVGPPGAGKTMAARRLPALLPSLSPEEALEVRRIAGVCSPRRQNGTATRPFRGPHHTISAPGLVGGGSPPRPGEVTLAHRGILFLDELAEFRRDALEALRQPLEEGRVTIARAGRTVELPCRFMLVAASNPCPCGRGADSGECRCHQAAIARYAAKLSGALADRIDLWISVARPSAGELSGSEGEGSSTVRQRVIAARERQGHRLGAGRCNADMTAQEARPCCKLDAEAQRLLDAGHERLGLSGRGWDRVLRVARTIADLGACDRIGAAHVSEALALRRRDPGE